ncbi:MAG: HNH endonuclease [Gemmatimonadetes bacterium]|nr:HNH endonuclease [Gemmatimonadota bacterium]
MSKTQLADGYRGKYRFSEATLREVFIRQGGKCAHCREKLNSAEKAEAHHVIPAQSADFSEEEHTRSFVRSADNCAAVCSECHVKAHGDSFASGAVAPVSWFRGMGGSRSEQRRLEQVNEDWWDRFAVARLQREWIQERELESKEESRSPDEEIARQTRSRENAPEGEVMESLWLTGSLHSVARLPGTR